MRSRPPTLLLVPLIFFSADNGKDGRELWVTDGLAGRTRMVKDINRGPGSSNPRDFVGFNGRVFFTADDGINGRQLWSSDGTAENTQPIKPTLRFGARGANPAWLTVFKDRLFFTADDGIHGRELWSTTGRDLDTTLFLD